MTKWVEFHSTQMGRIHLPMFRHPEFIILTKTSHLRTLVVSGQVFQAADSFSLLLVQDF